MKTCPNCSKKLNETFKYCNECGSIIESEVVGDFKTDYINVFEIEDEFVYLFSVKGRQVVLKANSIEELREFAKIRKFPWREPERNLLSNEVLLTKTTNDNYGIIGVSTLERNPAYSNLDKLFK
ncbi:zinc ribbon domain-containing protein [Methanobrevibacter sp.]|uniref:zinc ribbon domain-containing protein n=1 Tax=Methanobrevibacter sp. TaxID=66852 RepID=UPI002E7791EA|nr:zinc ribbon domain-containing protein [Methanobrevibacter sp.]MEE1336133.1 zinc ribbon domain-containing protein [Methanobrevibacter sp.]